MVAIGRGLMSTPTILMLDEPSLGTGPHFWWTRSWTRYEGSRRRG
ncbi:MAG: hypothetical protein U5R49_27635 [Deltaproteobacteria bacterium]|nr:hypothetical protein [Deltaproteobacteria bacterium]